MSGKRFAKEVVDLIRDESKNDPVRVVKNRGEDRRQLQETYKGQNKRQTPRRDTDKDKLRQQIKLVEEYKKENERLRLKLEDKTIPIAEQTTYYVAVCLSFTTIITLFFPKIIIFYF